MKTRIINKVYIVSVIQNSKVIQIITGKRLEDILFSLKLKYGECETQVMEYNDIHNIYVPDIEEYLMMIRRRRACGNIK